MPGSEISNAPESEQYFSFFHAFEIKNGSWKDYMKVRASKAGIGLQTLYVLMRVAMSVRSITSGISKVC